MFRRVPLLGASVPPTLRDAPSKACCRSPPTRHASARHVPLHAKLRWVPWLCPAGEHGSRARQLPASDCAAPHRQPGLLLGAPEATRPRSPLAGALGGEGAAGLVGACPHCADRGVQAAVLAGGHGGCAGPARGVVRRREQMEGGTLLLPFSTGPTQPSQAHPPHTRPHNPPPCPTAGAAVSCSAPRASPS